ncbi:hypothetical protein [Flavobacterium eburneipallidum]|uniref:hypothetical protein n=1 Tax=Flavobacterium eburneipallidum TaxID=3003263 RepID=UPI0022AC3AFB|nr:hypothetical protein [Flavobacterium eburneipallidum]
MLELIWGILNIAILIYFIIICFKATKIIRENLGGLAALVFVLGLLSFMGKTNKENTGFKNFNLEEETEKIENPNSNRNVYHTDKSLEDNLMTAIEMSILFTENTIEKKAINASVQRDGFISGTDWETTNVSLSKLNNNKYSYNVLGKLEWRILTITVYTEMKEFKGEIELKK